MSSRRGVALRALASRFVGTAHDVLGHRRSVFVVLALLLGSGLVYWRRGPVAAVVVDQIGLRRVEALADEIFAAATESRVEPELVAAIVFHESRGQVDAKSYAGALGLMQLVPAAAGDSARRLGLPVPTEADLLSDASLNLRLGASHLAWLLEHRGDWNMEQVLVAYNAGRVKLFRWIKRHDGYDAWRASEQAAEEEGGATGALRYALGVLEMRDRFRQRQSIRASVEAE